MRAKFIKEDAMGGVSSPGATLNNVPGVGNATPAAVSSNTNGTAGSGDIWNNSMLYTQDGKIEKDGKKKKGKKESKKKVKSPLGEMNINPYDQIATKLMGGKSPFKKKDSRTNQVTQTFFEEAPENEFRLPTLDQYAKAAEHVPVHHLETRKGKKMDEAVEPREQESLKDIKAKEELEKLSIPYIYKEGPSGKHRVYIKGMNVNDVVKKLRDLGWKTVGTNPEKTIKKFHKEDKEITIFADGKDLPRVTVTKVDEIASDMIESVLAKKIVSNSLEPYI